MSDFVVIQAIYEVIIFPRKKRHVTFFPGAFFPGDLFSG